MSGNLYYSAAERAAIGGRNAYSAVEFLQAVSGKGDDATIKVGTRSRFHSADGVYNRNQTLRETREAFRQAIQSTFGAAGEEALRRMFDGVGAVPLSARTIRAVYGEAEAISSRLMMEKRDRSGTNIFEQIVDKQMQVGEEKLMKVFADCAGQEMPFTAEMKASMRAVCLLDVRKRFMSQLEAKDVGCKSVDDRMLRILDAVASQSLKDTVERMGEIAADLLSENRDPAEVLTRADLPLAQLLSCDITSSLPFLDHLTARDPNLVDVAHPERLLQEIERRIGKMPTQDPKDAVGKLEDAFEELHWTIEPLAKTAVEQLNLTDEIADMVNTLCDSSDRDIGKPMREQVCQSVGQTVSAMLKGALVRIRSTPEMLTQEEWSDLKTRVLHEAVLCGLVDAEVEQQVDEFVKNHPGLKREELCTKSSIAFRTSQYWSGVLAADRADAMRELERVRPELMNLVKSALDENAKTQAARKEALQKLPERISDTLKEFGYGDLALDVNTDWVETKISAASSAEGVERRVTLFLTNLKDVAKILNESPLTPEMRKVMMRGTCQSPMIFPDSVSLAMKLLCDDRLNDDCGFSLLNEHSGVKDIADACLRFGRFLQHETDRMSKGEKDQMEFDTEERTFCRQTILRLLLVHHPKAVEGLKRFVEGFDWNSNFEIFWNPESLLRQASDEGGAHIPKIKIPNIRWDHWTEEDEQIMREQVRHTEILGAASAIITNLQYVLAPFN